MEKNSIFEVNGNAYDALSGAFIGHVPRIQPTTTVRNMPLRNTPQSNSIDGMVASPRRTASHQQPHIPQPTQTLMRHAVKPPQPGSLKPTEPAGSLRPAAVLQPNMPAAVTAAPQLSSASVTPQRAHMARVTGRSQAVQHFRPHARHATTPATTYAAPAPQPIAQPVVQTPAMSQAPRQQSTRPIAASRRPYTPNNLTVADSAPKQGLHQSQPRPASPEQSEQDLFAEALAQAKSHEEPGHKVSKLKSAKRKGSRARKVMIAGASLAVFVALCGIVGFQNRQQIQLQMASAKAGFAVASPLYIPQGYKSTGVTSASGNAAALYKSDTQQTFSIIQKKSNWNSETLLDSFVATSNQDYRGFQSNGRTVYVYGKGNATWVNGGVWYQIKDAKGLSDQQLVKIAASM